MLATRMRMAAAGVTGTPAAGWWLVAGKTCVAAYQPIGAASLAASYTNLANPGTHDAAPGTAPTHASATGWTFNGSTQYLTTGVVPGGGTWTAIARFSDVGVAGMVLGGQGGSGQFYLWIRTNFNQVEYGNSGFLRKNPAASSGVFGFAGKTAYRNGAPDGVINTNNGTQIAILLGAYNTGSEIPGLLLNGKIQAVAIYSDTLSGAEVAILSAAMAALT